MVNLYQVLQVDRGADPEVIDAAYERLTRQFDPDTSNLHYNALKLAHAVLKDPKQRYRYDRTLFLSELKHPVPGKPLLDKVEDFLRLVPPYAWWSLAGVLLVPLLVFVAFTQGRRTALERHMQQDNLAIVMGCKNGDAQCVCRTEQLRGLIETADPISATTIQEYDEKFVTRVQNLLPAAVSACRPKVEPPQPAPVVSASPPPPAASLTPAKKPRAVRPAKRFDWETPLLPFPADKTKTVVRVRSGV